MSKCKVSRIFFALTLLSITTAAHAGTYRCNGQVQFRPCGHPVADGKVPFESVVTAVELQRSYSKTPSVSTSRTAYRPSMRLQRPAAVVVRSFERSGAKDGVWRGFVSGKGHLLLNLKFIKDGQLKEERVVGRVFLPVSKTTTFAVRTTVPSGKRWTWELEAFQDIA